LFSIESISPSGIHNIQEKPGIQTVPIDQIRGSEGRVRDFDRNFNPLEDRTRERWMGIASARMRGKRLPAVILIQIGDLYFVRDGHHRISVARALGDTSIEAKVIVWQVNGSLPWDTPSTLPSWSSTDQPGRLPGLYQSLQRLWRRLCQHFMPKELNPALD
jgi:hypothetical protein